MKKLLTKKTVKRVLTVVTLLALAVALAGCSAATGTGAGGAATKAVSHTSGNWWDRYVVYYMSQFLLWLASFLGNNYGWTIVLFTVIVRLILLPLNAMSSKSMTKQQKLQPQMDALRKKYPGKDAESRQQLAEETNKLYKEAGINPYAGCLPMLIQLPIMFALYQAIIRTPQLQNGHFFWLNLSRADPYYIMPILAAVFTFMSSYISQMSMPPSSQTMMTKSMTYIMPIVVAVPAISFPSAITLYWVVTNLFQVVQTFILQNPFKYQRELEAEKAAERERKHQIRKVYKRIKKHK